MRNVRDGAFDVLRSHNLTTLFANPGSTEVPLLGDLPEDLRFVLGLHEGSVVGMATGAAIAREDAAVVVLHTTAGLGNAVGALATARENKAPLLVLVGQQDRRHLTLEPFLTGRLRELAGAYPVWVGAPARAQDVPSVLARGAHEARAGAGPALVEVPMDDWSEPLEETETLASPGKLRTRAAHDPELIDELANMLGEAHAPMLVVGAGADHADTWSALVSLAEKLRCPVWQEAFGARAGFPQDHPLFAGHLPATRASLRETLSAHDLVLAVGAPVFRQYHYEPGPLLPAGTRVAMITAHASEAHHSAAERAIIGDPARLCSALTDTLTSPLTNTLPDAVSEPLSEPRPDTVPGRAFPTSPADEPSSEPAPETATVSTTPVGSQPHPTDPLHANDVFAALGARLDADTIVVEETPSSRARLQTWVPARAPLGFLSAAMGGLGFALPAATGVRMASPFRPVVAVVGDGSAMYGIQALWSAAHYSVGTLFVVLSNGGYAIMDQLANQAGTKPPWPGFGEVDIHGIACCLGCQAHKVRTAHELTDTLDAITPNLRNRSAPVLVEVEVKAGT